MTAGISQQNLIRFSRLYFNFVKKNPNCLGWGYKIKNQYFKITLKIFFSA
jgi:hypothetical protein